MKRLTAWFLSFCLLAPTSVAFAESSVGKVVEEYKFVINGEQWTHDPENPIRKGPFNNTVVRVREH